MCFHRNYKIYYSKRRSLKIVRKWHFLPHKDPPSDGSNGVEPVLLTVKAPLSVVVELAAMYGAYITTDTTVLDSESDIVLKVFSQGMAEELIKRGSRVIMKK